LAERAAVLILVLVQSLLLQVAAALAVKLVHYSTAAAADLRAQMVPGARKRAAAAAEKADTE
jgi:hypothetical protein